MCHNRGMNERIVQREMARAEPRGTETGLQMPARKTRSSPCRLLQFSQAFCS
jgi:hypothetical protein